MDTVHAVPELRLKLRSWREENLRIALVPTMGALHAGHLELVRRGLKLADRVVATIFVNPKQFGPNEDFSVYPRDEAGDAAKLESVGTHLLFAPGLGEMYPEGATTQVLVPGIGDLLEGEFRPGFFTGVATVVTKLLLQSLPDVAIFGEKDWQQLQVIRRLAADLDIPVTIEGAATVREADGLAMSSRNAYLSPEQRLIAASLNRVLGEMAKRFQLGEDIDKIESRGRDALLQAGFDKVDYATIRDAASLCQPQKRKPARVLGAAWLGRARLIDNLPG